LPANTRGRPAVEGLSQGQPLCYYLPPFDLTCFGSLAQGLLYLLAHQSTANVLQDAGTFLAQFFTFLNKDLKHWSAEDKRSLANELWVYAAKVEASIIDPRGILAPLRANAKRAEEVIH
jgi:hypothetical protein